MRNSVEFWNDVAQEVVRRDFTKRAGGLPAAPDQDGPTRTSRALAIVHIAMHDAYFGCLIAQNPTVKRYLVKVGATGLPTAAANASADSALGTAAAVSLLTLYPSHAAFINRMSATFIDPNPTASQRDDGHRFGEGIAHAILKLRENDGSNIRMGYRPSTAYGRHREDPYGMGQGFLGPQWGQVARFCLPNHAPLDPPPGYNAQDYLSNADYREDFEEVKAKGSVSSATRKADEKCYGLYWGYDGANEIGVPPRLYNQVARAWLEKHHAGDIVRQTRLLMQVNVAMADAGIDAWHHKYVYNLWRPVLGIREAGKACGPAAQAGTSAAATPGADIGDPYWMPLGLPKTNEPELRAYGKTPGFPAYPSGHATFGTALFQVMQLFSSGTTMNLADVLAAENSNTAVAGQDFDFVSDEMDGKSVDADGSVRTRHNRHYKSFAKATFENSLSRVFLGVHWRFDGLPRKAVAGQHIGGVPLGLQIGSETFNFLK